MSSIVIPSDNYQIWNFLYLSRDIFLFHLVWWHFFKLFLSRFVNYHFQVISAHTLEWMTTHFGPICCFIQYHVRIYRQKCYLWYRGLIFSFASVSKMIFGKSSWSASNVTSVAFRKRSYACHHDHPLSLSFIMFLQMDCRLWTTDRVIVLVNLMMSFFSFCGI